MQVIVGILICILALVGLYFAVKAVVGFDIVGPGEDSLNQNIRKRTIDVGRNAGLKQYTEGSGSSGADGTGGRGADRTGDTQGAANKNPYPYSPFYGTVVISSVRPAPYPASVGGTFTLSGGTTQGVNITGWQLKGNKGNVVISQAVADLSMSGSLTPSDIILYPNSYVYAYDHESPIKASFRLNKCTGYLNNRFVFYPSLPEYCPSILTYAGEITSFSGACQSYIRSIGTCDDVSPQNKNYFSYDAACRQFLDRVGFEMCYSKHRYDSDFFANEWRLWLRQEFLFDQQHDRVRLLDKSGLIVSEYTY